MTDDAVAAERELFAELRASGDEDLRCFLITRFDWLARRCAARYQPPGAPPDIVHVARVGLIGAVDRYDPCRNHRFPAFARPTITGEIKRYLRDTTWPLAVPRRW